MYRIGVDQPIPPINRPDYSSSFLQRQMPKCLGHFRPVCAMPKQEAPSIPHVQNSLIDSRHCNPEMETLQTISSVETNCNYLHMNLNCQSQESNLSQNWQTCRKSRGSAWTPWAVPPAFASCCWSAGQLQDSSQLSCPSCHELSQDSSQLPFQTCEVSSHDWSLHQDPSSCHHMPVPS